MCFATQLIGLQPHPTALTVNAMPQGPDAGMLPNTGTPSCLFPAGSSWAARASTLFDWFFCETDITPSLSGTQGSKAVQVPAETKNAPDSSSRERYENLERETGIEPATLSLGT